MTEDQILSTTTSSRRLPALVMDAAASSSSVAVAHHQQELRRDLTNLRAIVDHQTVQLTSLARHQQRSKVEEQVASLSTDLAELKESVK
jgi:acetyl-CoA carboxylase alpha subunit